MTDQPRSLHMASQRLNLFADAWQDFQVQRYLGYATNGGATLGEVLRIVSQIAEGDLESWYAAWTAMALRLREQGEALLGAGHRVDARAALLRASNYFHAGEHFLDHEDARR